MNGLFATDKARKGPQRQKRTAAKDGAMEYASENGFTGVMYGKSSFTVYDKDGNEVLHTGSRGFNTYEALKEQVEGFPKFYEALRGQTRACTKAAGISDPAMK